MRAARIESSTRLQRVINILADGQEHSTYDLIQSAGVCAVNSIISEIRRNGHDIVCRQHKRVWYYRMVS